MSDRVNSLERLTIASHPDVWADEFAAQFKTLQVRPSSRRGFGVEQISLHSLSKENFIEDLRQSLPASAFKVEYLSRKSLKFLGHLHLPSASDFNYRDTVSSFPAAHLEYARHVHAITARLFSAYNVRNILSGNFVYWSEQEVAKSLRNIGGKFLVYHKEALLSEWQSISDGWRRAVMRGCVPFAGSSIAFASEGVRDLAISTGVVDTAGTSCVVTGSPRIDICHQARGFRRFRRNPRRIAFFSLSDTSGITFPHDPIRHTHQASWHRLGEELAECVIHTLFGTPESVRVAVQIKRAHRDSAFVARLQDLVKELPKAATNRLSIRMGGDGGRLARESSVAVAFNSTVALEAIASGTPLIVPRLGEARSQAATSNLLDLGRSAHEVDDARELSVLVGKFADARKAPVLFHSDASAVLARALGNPDGLASRRFRRWLTRESADTKSD